MSDHAAKVKQTLGFLQSVILSGESFTETVAAEYCEAVDAVDALAAELAAARAALAIARPYVEQEYGTGDWVRRLENDQEIIDAALAAKT